MPETGSRARILASAYDPSFANTPPEQLVLFADVSAEGISLLAAGPAGHGPLAAERIPFGTVSDGPSGERAAETVRSVSQMLSGRSFAQVTCCLSGLPTVLVPAPLTPAAAEEAVFAFSQHRDPADRLFSEPAGSVGAKFLYAVPPGLVAACDMLFGGARTVPAGAVLLHAALEQAASGDRPKVWVNCRSASADVLILRDRHPLFFNTFPISGPEDLLYYAMNALEQAGGDTRQAHILMGGDEERCSALLPLADRYAGKAEAVPAPAGAGGPVTARFSYPGHFILYTLPACA